MQRVSGGKVGAGDTATSAFVVAVDAVRQLMAPSAATKMRPIKFVSDEK
jgi:hypothetical protein